MATVMTSTQFISLARRAADGKSIYVSGGFGANMGLSQNKTYYINAYPFNNSVDPYGKNRADVINAATNGTFGFDCVCLIKGILWNWTGDLKSRYGGATYKANGVPDFTIDQMLNKYSTNVSTVFDLNKMVPGEIVVNASKGHCGIYIGDGLVVESTYRWKDGAQYTSCNCGKSGYNRRDWAYHGLLSSFINYNTVSPSVAADNIKKLADMVDTKVLCKQGDRGDYVKQIQLVLIDKGFSVGSTGADGVFGANTTNGVKLFQTKYSLPVTGQVKLDTIEYLLKTK